MLNKRKCPEDEDLLAKVLDKCPRIMNLKRDILSWPDKMVTSRMVQRKYKGVQSMEIIETMENLDKKFGEEGFVGRGVAKEFSGSRFHSVNVCSSFPPASQTARIL